MSKSSSTGDLVPRDITEILALQSKISKSKKKRGSSLGRAFSWFKGSNLKKSASNGQIQSGGHGGLTPEFATIRHGHDKHDSKAGQKQDEQGKLTVHYTATQHYPENVFVEGNRPKYLEDLHIEAQEGLKILQQEEQNNGMDFEDDQSTSTGTTQEKDVNGQDTDGRLSYDGTADTSVSTVSALSLRPVLTRQGSTFKPLNTIKRLEKSKKRNRRTTIMGIPQQVQRELSMGRGHILQQITAGEDGGTVIIPTTDGGAPVTNHNGARVHLQDIEALQDFREEKLLRQHIQAVYKEDLFQNGKPGPQTSHMQRPKSLAVPGITTSSAFLQEPQGPVMSMSPQATYLSTIIPNAILPSSIDVIEIDRTCNRSSVHMVSKNSLASASPRSSRSGGGTHDEPPSTSSKWSSSQSSETMVSNPSTISFKGSAPHSQVADGRTEVTELNEEKISLKSSASWSSSTSKGANQRQEHGELSNGGETARNSRLFSRNLAVTKAKLPPVPPPRRTNPSHHERLTQRSREMKGTKEVKYSGSNGRHVDEDLNTKQEPASSYSKRISTHSPVSVFLDDSHTSVAVSPHSPGQESTGAQTESMNSSRENQIERTVSPSSGYSSQSVTPTHSSKEISPVSPGRLKVKPPKPERISTRITPVVPVTQTPAIPAPCNQHTQTETCQSKPQKVSLTTTETNKISASTAATLRELFNIPPPPKVKAPSLPPPEAWIHNRRTTELLCGPAPNTQRINEFQKHQQKDKLLKVDQTTATNTDQPAESRIFVEINTTGSLSEDNEVMTEPKEHILVEEQVALDKSQALKPTKSPLVHEVEESPSQVIHKNKLNTVGGLEVQDEPKGHQDHQRVSPTPEHFKTESCHHSSGVLPENGTLTPKVDETKNEDQYVIKYVNDKEIPNHGLTQNLNVDVPRTSDVSPSPSPPPEHPPPPPPSKTSPSSQRSQEEEQTEKEKELHSLEASWPPPPPPMSESSDLVFEGQDEIDFPPPPPPILQEPPLDMSENCNIASSQQGDILAPPDTSDATSHTEPNPETQITQNTTTLEKTSNEPTGVNPILKASRIPEDKAFEQSNGKVQIISQVHTEISPQSQTEVIPPAPQHDPPAPPTTSHAPAHSTDSSLTTLPTEDQSTVNFRRQPNLSSKDSRSKDQSSRNKSAPIPKEDANIPLVTPSLLQMVRLRSVNVEDQTSMDSQEDKASTQTNQDQNQCTSSQVTPQKPVRKSCLKSAQSSPATISAPSMRLQEAIRMKTAAMTSSGLPARPSLHISSHIPNSNHVTALSPKTPDVDVLKSPASTASFIFSKSSKKVIIDTPSSPEAQASLKQNLAAELMQISELKVTNGTKKPLKVPPPVAKKPVHATNSSDKPKTATATSGCPSSVQRNGIANNQQADRAPPAGQQEQSPGNEMPESKSETASTVQES